MYFSLLPDVQYDSKPISYPFSESDYIVAKNFFRRHKITDEVFASVVYYQKYTIQDQDRPDTIANDVYGNPLYDWVVLLTNNIINPLFDWPMSEYQLREYLDQVYDDPYREIAQYRTDSAADQISQHGSIIIEPDKVVDEKFYNSNTVWNWQDPPPAPTETQFVIDLSDPNNIADDVRQQSDVSILSAGTGTGSDGGFSIGTHLKFGALASNPDVFDNVPGTIVIEPRYAVLKPNNIRNYATFRLKGIRANGFNGGETPDAANEDLRIRLWDNTNNLTTFDSSQCTLLSDEVIIGITAQSSVETDANNEDIIYYELPIPLENRKENVFIELYQEANSGICCDHYGLLEFTFYVAPELLDYTDYETIDDNTVKVNGVLYQKVIDESTGQERWGIKQTKGYTFYDEQLGRSREIPGQDISRPVTVFEVESEKNERKREIYLLKDDFVTAFIEEFKTENRYKNSNSFISNRLKQAGI